MIEKKLNKKIIAYIFVIILTIGGIFGYVYTKHTKQQSANFSKIITENYPGNFKLIENSKSANAIIKYRTFIATQKIIDPITLSDKVSSKYNCDNSKFLSLDFAPNNPLGIHLNLGDGRNMLMYAVTFDGGIYTNKDVNTFLILKNIGIKVIEGDKETYSNCIKAI